jgi:hypothetical protein
MKYPLFLLVAVLSELFLALMRCDLVTLFLLSAGHNEPPSGKKFSILFENCGFQTFRAIMQKIGPSVKGSTFRTPSVNLPVIVHRGGW